MKELIEQFEVVQRTEASTDRFVDISQTVEGADGVAQLGENQFQEDFLLK